MVLSDRHTFHCGKYFVLGEIRACSRVVRCTVFAVCSKPPSRGNHSTASYYVQQRQNIVTSRVWVEFWSCESESLQKLHLCPFWQHHQYNWDFQLNQSSASFWTGRRGHFIVEVEPNNSRLKVFLSSLLTLIEWSRSNSSPGSLLLSWIRKI